MVVWNVYKIKLLVVGRDRPSVGTGRDLSLPMAAEYPFFKIHFLKFHHKFNRNLRKKTWGCLRINGDSANQISSPLTFATRLPPTKKRPEALFLFLI